MTSQAEFRAALLDGARAVPEGLNDANGHPAGRRFDVYRNNVAVSLTEALESGFPVIAKLLGEENFKAVSGVYLRQSPPENPLMMHYGRSFPAFLAGFEPLSHLRYLGDVAELELALRRSYHAADSNPLAGDVLARIPENQLENLQLGLAPSVQVVSSPWPIHDIWTFNMVEDAPKPRPVAQDVLVVRAEFDPEPLLMPDGGAVFVTALLGGETLGAAASQAVESQPDFDLSAALALLLNSQAITSATT